MEHEIKSIFKLTPIEKEDKKRELTEGHSMKVETTSARTTFWTRNEFYTTMEMDGNLKRSVCRNEQKNYYKTINGEIMLEK